MQTPPQASYHGRTLLPSNCGEISIQGLACPQTDSFTHTEESSPMRLRI